MLTGGCTCGAIRFQIEEPPYDTGWCHCRTCQHTSGSVGMIFTTAAKDAYRITQGVARLGHYKSTAFGRRTFCRDCGAPLTIHVDHQPDEIDIAVSSLDDPSAVEPGFHLFVEHAPSWLTFADALPRFAELRPDTRGLEPGRTTL